MKAAACGCADQMVTREDMQSPLDQEHLMFASPCMESVSIEREVNDGRQLC
jgi:hypothetical protein